MFKRSKDIALVCGFFCMVFVFLAAGLASAACIGSPCVDEPGDVVKVLRSGSTSNIEVSIATDPFAFPVTKYKLFYACLGPDFGSWRLITTRSCNPYVGCPSTYPWSPVPYLPQLEVSGDGIGNDDGFCDPGEACSAERTCAIRVVAIDNAGRAAAGIGGKFLILPPNVAPSFLYIRPLVRTVGAGGSASFQAYGREPYTVDVASAHQSYIAVNGSSVFPVSVSDPTPLTPVVFTVTNTYSCGTSQEVIITVTDSAGESVSALYVIACP